MSERAQSQTATGIFDDCQSLVPRAELLTRIRNTDQAVRARWTDSICYDRKHFWVVHTPDGRREFLGVKFTETQRAVVTGDLQDAQAWLTASSIDDGELAAMDTVPVEQTPIPYKREDTLHVECPECGRFGTTHPWKLDDYLPDECPCGYGGEWNVD